MTAVRSTNHSGREYEVSDETGVVDELLIKDLSITEQVEKVFLTDRCRDALDNMSPNKMQTLGEEAYMQMNPDEFATAMEEIPDVEGDEAYLKDIMTSRQDVVSIDVKDNFSEVFKCIVENNYSRVPVFQGTIDNIKGILYIKDVLPHLGKSATFRWQSLIRPPYFVPETKKIDDLLHEFQENKVHIAIVVDEFGGTSGIITLEDIIEEIVGEIKDEYDEEEKFYTHINANTYIFEGKTMLSDFYKILKLDDDYFDEVAEGADTLAGLMLMLKGEFPVEGERIDMKDFTFEIVEMDERRVVKVKVIQHK